MLASTGGMLFDWILRPPATVTDWPSGFVTTTSRGPTLAPRATSKVTVTLVGLLTVTVLIVMPLTAPPGRLTVRWLGKAAPGSKKPVPVRVRETSVWPWVAVAAGLTRVGAGAASVWIQVLQMLAGESANSWTVQTVMSSAGSRLV